MSNLIAIASNKDGVGKTWFAITLAHALSGFKQKVLFFDGDLGLGNVDFQLGLFPKNDLSDVVNDRKTLNQLICSYDKARIDLIASRSGSLNLASVPVGRLQILGDDLNIIAASYDKVIMDMSSGVDKSALILSGIAGKIIILCTNEPSSLTEAYAFIKIIHSRYPNAGLEIVVNQADSVREGQHTYNTLLKACKDFLNISPKLLGVVRRDTRVRDAIRNQITILSRYPTSEASEDVINIARKLLEK